MKLFFR